MSTAALISRRSSRWGDARRTSRRQVRETFDLPQNVLDRLEEIGVLSPTARGYDPLDIQNIEAISRLCAGGYEQTLGFTVYDTLRYREAPQPVVEDEVRLLVARLAAQVETERAVQIIESGVEPLHDPISAMHSNMPLAELRCHRAADAA